MVRNKKRLIAGCGAIVIGVFIAVIAEWLTNLNPISHALIGISWLFGLFVYTITLPIWGLMILWISGPLLIAILSWLANRGAEWQKYTSDSILGVKWHWNYFEGSVEDLYPACPNCSMELDPVRVSSYAAVDYVMLVCDHCEFKKSYELDNAQLFHIAKKEIRRRIRTEEYKEKITRASPKK